MKLNTGLLAVLLAVTLSACGGGGSSNRATVALPPPTPNPVDDITVAGAVIDGPVSGGRIYLFGADTIQSALDAANAADDRAASLDGAGALAVIEQEDDSDGVFIVDVSGDLAGRAVFIVFDSVGAVDETFGDTPFNMESVAVLGAEGTTKRVNITPHTTVVAIQVRQALPLDDTAVEGEIAAALENLAAVFGNDQAGAAVIPEGVNLIATTDSGLLEEVSIALASLVRSTATLTGLAREAILEALALDALDGAIDGNIPIAVDQAIADVATATDEVQSLGEGSASDIVIGSCASVATLLKRSCDVDIMDDYLEGVALCQDADVADEDELDECIAQLDEEREETLEECAAVHSARVDLCGALDDAVHEPEFGPEYADNFVDPADIGDSVDPNPYFPLVPGNEWVYEATFIDEDSGEEVTETITVTVLESTKLIEGIDCVVVKDIVEEDGELIEDTDDWFAQDLDGNVWYCGEIAKNFEYFEGDEPQEAELVDLGGSWKAGRDGAKAGILVPADPEVGDVIRNEVLYGDAEDVIEVVNLAGAESTAIEDCEGVCLVLQETTPLEPEAQELTYYKPGVGVIVEVDVETGDRAELISFTQGGGPALAVDAKVLVEHNATDEDTGFQGFGDGDPYNELTISGPGGFTIATVTALGGLLDFGITELFFETSEPENAEVPIATVLARLPEGTYTYSADLVDAEEDSVTTPLTHDIPEGPELVSPAEDATGIDPAATVMTWDLVETDLDGEEVEIVGYQVIVEEVGDVEFPAGFYKPWLSAFMSDEATSVTVPVEFMRNDACYEWEVLAIEVSGNQTLSSSAFETGTGCTGEEGEDPEGLKAGKFLIEHNATDEDTGFQGFVDGDPWNMMTITDSAGTDLANVTPSGGLFDFGMTELFFETSEPPNDEVPISDVLARVPEGTVTFAGLIVGADVSTFETLFTHNIPMGPELLTPQDGDEEVDPAETVVSWEPVTTDLDGDPITIVGYQVIVEIDEEPVYPATFAEPWFSVYVPANVTSVTVPPEFMEADTDYAYEVLAIEESGNQTLSSAEFATLEEE